MLAKPSDPARIFVLASSFYTAALERPMLQALIAADTTLPVQCVPYNQLHTFLLDPHSAIPEDTPAKVVLLLRVEDLVRLELVALDPADPGAMKACVNAFRERTEQFLDVLSRMSRLALTLVICPSGRGAYKIDFLGSAIRVAEHKIAAELRSQQRHHVISWSEFERTAKPESCFNPSGDRLGHVPFTPAGLDALAAFLSTKLSHMPTTTLTRRSAGAPADLDRFLNSLAVAMAVSPLTSEDEPAAINLVRHTTHFINWPGRKLEDGGIRALAADFPAGEAWVVRVRDRFGDYGVSGALTFSLERRTMRVGLLFLTCPVLGRQVEYALMAWVASLAALRGADIVEIPFVPGRDNLAMQDLLQRLAEPLANESTKEERIYRLNVSVLANRALSEAPSSAGVSAILSSMQAGQISATA